MLTATSTSDLTILLSIMWPTPQVTGPINGVWTVTCEDEVTQETLDMYVASAETTAAVEAARLARIALIQGAKARAQQIITLAQTPAARGATAWTQVQRVAILDAIGDLAKMVSWVADDILGTAEQPQTLV